MSTITDEQQQVIDCDADLLAVEAFAGSGKTFTLVEYTYARPGYRILYIAFNRSVASEAQNRFPENVKCKTTHALAYAAVGKRYSAKLGNPQVWELTELFNCNNKRAKDALTALNNWFCSADDEVSEDHLDPGVLPATLSGQEALKLARNIWKSMKDVRGQVKMPHDGYLKLWALSKPKLNYDIVLLDEAQDTNPVTLDVFLRQECQKVLVGDRHQGIYGFRKAVNAMEAVDAECRLSLTQSFRFSDDVAKIATRLLAEFKGETNTIKGRSDISAAWEIDDTKHYIVIGRTNAGLFSRAAHAVLAGVNQMHFVGGFNSYLFGNVLDAYYLWHGEQHRIKNPNVSRFMTFRAFKEYGIEAGDAEISALVKTVEAFGDQIPRIYEAIKAAEVSEVSDARVSYSTGHRAKGLEFDQVFVDDDFIEVPPKEDYDPEEINLLYVAITRAIRAVRLPVSVVEWLAVDSTVAGCTDLKVGLNQSTVVQLADADPETVIRNSLSKFQGDAREAIEFLLARLDYERIGTRNGSARHG